MHTASRYLPPAGASVCPKPTLLLQHPHFLHVSRLRPDSNCPCSQGRVVSQSADHLAVPLLASDPLTTHDRGSFLAGTQATHHITAEKPW